MTKVTQLSLDDKDGHARQRIHLREISGDGEGPAETVGGALRAGRLRRGDDLATVSQVLKIRKDHLEAVEEDNLDALPGKTYAIGFVRSYAAYLGLDAATLVERFKQEIAGRHEEVPPISPVHTEERRLPQGWRIVALIVVAALGYGVWHLLSAGPAPESVPPPPALTPPHTAVTPPPAQTAPPAGTQAGIAQPATPPAQPGGAAGALNTGGAAAAAPTAGTALPVPPSGGTAYGTHNKGARVVLHVLGDTHILVRGENGMVYINRDLHPGDSYALPNIVGLTLSATNAGAVEVDLDGTRMGLAGTGQQPADDLSMDPQDIVDRSSGH